MPKRQEDATSAQMLKLASIITRNLPKYMPEGRVVELNSNPGALALLLRQVLAPPIVTGNGSEVIKFPHGGILVPKKQEEATTTQMLELASGIIESLPTDMGEDRVIQLSSDPEALAVSIRQMLLPPTGSGAKTRELQVLGHWDLFYRDVFCLDVGDKDFYNMHTPARRPGFNRAIVTPKGLTVDMAYAKCDQLFSCWKYFVGSLGEAVLTNDRLSGKNYAIWVRDRVEADKELKNKSADDLKLANTPGITLLERLTLEIKYFKETGKHLDVENSTACTGSRYSDGSVPFVRWRNNKLMVGWNAAAFRDPGLCSREVVF